jgi:hypothetical protein
LDDDVVGCKLLEVAAPLLLNYEDLSSNAILLRREESIHSHPSSMLVIVLVLVLVVLLVWTIGKKKRGRG